MMRDTFLRFLKHGKRYSDLTISSYKNDLDQLSAYLCETYELEDLLAVEHDHLRSWVLELVKKKLSPRSVNRKIATAKSFYKFLLKNLYIEVSPAERLKNLKAAKKLPETIKEKELSQLLDNTNFTDGFEGMRDLLMLELLYGLGIRLSELIAIKEQDFNDFRKIIKIFGKGSKIRILPIPIPLLNLIRNYKSLKKQEGIKNNFLIVTDNGNKLYPMFVQRKVKQYLGTVTTLDKRSPHILRHSYATHLLLRGADIHAIKDLLGHSSLLATQIYTQYSIEKLKKTFEQAHPKA